MPTVNRFTQKMSSLALNIKFIFRPEGLILDTHELSTHIRLVHKQNNGVGWCMGVGTYKRNLNRHVFATKWEIFKWKFAVRGIRKVSIVS